MAIGKMGADFDFASLKLLLKGTTAEVLLPGDGEKYEKSIERWSEHCTKRAVSKALIDYHFNFFSAFMQLFSLHLFTRFICIRHLKH